MGGIGYKEKGNIYRPTIRINEKTPTTFSELLLNQIIKAKQEKAKIGHVKDLYNYQMRFNQHPIITI